MIKKGVVIVSILIIIFLIVSSLLFIFFTKSSHICNDGTISGECSKIKSYFCSEGNLIENASSCGCSNLSVVNSNSCISNYEINPKEITLNYTLRGEKGQINFTVYEKLYTYLSKLPRFQQYDINKDSVLLDFKLKSLDNQEQRELLLPLVIKIQNLAENKEDQARIAISLVQNIPFGNSTNKIRYGGIVLDYYRFPYEVLYDMKGVCGEKSELLAFLLREIGYESAFIYYQAENHEALGIKCPAEKSLNNSGFCFIETTGPSIISDYNTEYLGTGQLSSIPQIIPIPENLTFGKINFYEFRDSKILNKIRERMRNYGTVNFIQHLQFQELKKKYGLEDFSAYVFETE